MSEGGFLALGDSFTAGTGCEPGESWADLLAARLGFGTELRPYENLSFDGATSADVLDQLEESRIQRPAVVSVICGANDVLRSTRPDIDAFRERLAELYRLLGERASEARLITSTYPESWGFVGLRPRTQARVCAGVEQVNRAIRELAEGNDALLIDISDHPGLGDAANFAHDGLHPSADAHRGVADAFIELLGFEKPEESHGPQGSEGVEMKKDRNGSGATAGPEVGMAIESAGRTITEADLVGFSSLTGDWHPQHGDARWAAESGFGERIAHGMLVLSYSVGLVGFDPERVVALRGLDSVRFKRPVRIGDTISVEAIVRNVKPIGEQTSLVEFGWTVSTAESGTAIKAKVQVLWKDSEVPDERGEVVTISAPDPLYPNGLLL